MMCRYASQLVRRLRRTNLLLRILSNFLFFLLIHHTSYLILSIDLIKKTSDNMLKITYIIVPIKIIGKINAE